MDTRFQEAKLNEWAHILLELNTLYIKNIIMCIHKLLLGIYIWMGSSMIKWTSHDPYMWLSESDSKLYTDFKFYELVMNF